jgi:hypothetical protein
VIVSFRPARASDAREIVPRLRARDLAGLCQAGDPVDVVIEGLQTSIAAWTVLADGEIAVLFGFRLAMLLDDRVYLWMLGTTVIDQHPVTFLRKSRGVVRLMRKHYSLVYGEVACDYERSIRWLTWLGGKVRPGPEPGRMVFSL